MPVTISDIFKILCAVRPYMEKGSAPRKYVEDTFNDLPVRQARIPNYKEVEETCSKIGLLSIESSEIRITQAGKEILEYYERDNLDDEFKETFIKDVIFGPDIGEEIRSDLSKFYVENNVMAYPKKDIHKILTIDSITPILYEINLLEKKDDIIEINPKYTQLIHRGRRKITQRQLEFQLDIQKIIGEIGEEISLAFEKGRLEKAGCITEASKASRISVEFANAGYDIESFYKDKDGVTHKAYIEVKGSVETSVDFYWSSNEIKKAKELGADYWVYFIPGIDIQTRQSSREPIRIQNPYNVIFDNPDWMVEPEQYHVTKDTA